MQGPQTGHHPKRAPRGRPRNGFEALRRAISALEFFCDATRDLTVVSGWPRQGVEQLPPVNAARHHRPKG